MNLLAVLVVGMCCRLTTSALVLLGPRPSYQPIVNDGAPTVASPVSGPLLERNLDDTDYWVHFKGDTHADLSCKTNYAPDSGIEPDAENDGQIEAEEETGTVYLELHEKDGNAYIWKDSQTAHLADNIYHLNPLTPPPPPRSKGSGDESGFRGGYSICTTFLPNERTITIGMVDWGAPGQACQMYHNGQLVKAPRFSILFSPQRWIPRNYTWATVRNWRDIPASAFMPKILAKNVRDCLNTSGLATGKRYIGKLTSPGLPPVILDLTEGAEEAKILPPGYPITGAGVIRQVLVYHPLVSFKFKSLICQPAPAGVSFNLSQHREEANLYVKAEQRGQGKFKGWKEMEKVLEYGTIFSKVAEKPSMMWKSVRPERTPPNTVFPLLNFSGQSYTLLCRYRCVYGENPCMWYPTTTANGTFIYRKMDQLIGRGKSDLRTSLCQVVFNGQRFTTPYFDWLLNPCGVSLYWVPLTDLSPSKGKVAVTRGNGETFAIARYSFPRAGLDNGTVAQVQLDVEKKRILFTHAVPFHRANWETHLSLFEKENMKVDILMIQD